MTAHRVWLSCIALVCVVLFESLWLCSPARAAGDPYLEWWTLETPHFRIHYYKGLEPVAEKIASLAEGINSRLSDSLGWKVTEVTEIVLTDNTDDANGSATPVPYNTIRLFVTAPEDLSTLGDYDDWYLELLTHEDSHIVHLDNITGVPALVNKIMGKWWAPNLQQPAWLREGLAVHEESEHTSGGRIRSSLFDMYLRADVLEKRLAPLDQMSHSVRRWPQGNIWYLYGSHFLEWITDVYGDQVLREVARDYGRQILPWSINRSVRRATGQTYEQLYEGWSAYLTDHYAEQMKEVEARGIREGTRLTHHGQTVGNPRFVPPAAKKTKAPLELLYFRDDGHSRGGFYRLSADGAAPRKDPDEELVVRSSGHGSVAISASGKVVWNSVAVSNRIYAFNDLFLLPPLVDAPSGFEPERKRLTEGERAQDPDISANGHQVVFTENHRGTQTLMIAELDGEDALGKPRTLVPSARFEQAYTPRFSPDGKWVVYSAWTAGGYRDIRLVDVATGQFSELTHDRALDWEPSFSPDGQLVFFASDRALGIPNIFAFDRATNKIWQVTNVRTGAFYPEVSSDGRTLIYVGYTSFGHDLFSLPLDRSTWMEPPVYVDVHPDPPDPAPSAITGKHRYNPFPLLRPRSWTFDYGPGTYGTAISISTSASDPVGHHGISASLLVDTERGDPQGAISYAYGRLPFDFRTTLYRSLVPINYSPNEPTFTRQSLGVATGISYNVLSEFESQSFSLAYSLSRFDGAIPLSRTPDPYQTLHADPPRGQIGSVHLGWSYSNADGTLHGVGAERGFSLALSADVATPELASDYTLYIFGYTASEYLPMPWGHHHTLALHGASSISTGNYPYLGPFYTGGFVEAPLFKSYTLGAYQGPFVLRGYPSNGQINGSQYHLYNAEYRFPIVNVDHGISTLPAFLQRLNGNVFADYGGAFNDIDAHNWRDKFHLGVGAELWIEFTVGYYLTANMRVGYARGIADPLALPGGQTYVVLSAPF